MKCYACGRDITEGARFCGTCGSIMAETPKQYCVNCGAELYPGAAFCGKCGKPKDRSSVVGAVPVIVGAAHREDASRISTSYRDGRPSGTGSRSVARTIRRKTRPLSEWAGKKFPDKARAKKLLIIVFVIGLCITIAGLSGKILMNEVTTKLKSTEYFQGLDSQFDGMLNRAAGSKLTGLIVAVIRNDPSGFVNAVREILKITGSLVGGSYGMENVGAMFAEAAFGEVREEVIQQAGAYWPLLQALAWYKELLIVGLIILLAAAALWYLLGGRISDIRLLRIRPALTAGACWIGIVLVLTIIGINQI